MKIKSVFAVENQTWDGITEQFLFLARHKAKAEQRNWNRKAGFEKYDFREIPLVDAGDEVQE